MKYTKYKEKVILEDYNSFDIEHILECGQCFRFSKLGEKHYNIIAFNKVLYIKQNDNEKKIEFYPCTISEFENTWINYFDLNRNYQKIKDELSKNDIILKEAINFASGIRILNQDIFECLISFIISQNNRIPMIKKVINNLSQEYGENIVDNYYSFPAIDSFKNVQIEDIIKCKTGFRGKYIKDAIIKISDKEIILEDFKSKTTKDLKKTLMKIYGVGEKVSDCVMLFSNGRYEVFPTDVWVKRVMEHFYFDNKKTNIKDIHRLSEEKWGQYSGFAQQYLFHYARQNKIGKK